VERLNSLTNVIAQQEKFLDKFKYTIIESILKVLNKLHTAGLSPINHKFLINNPKFNSGLVSQASLALRDASLVPASNLSYQAKKKVTRAIKKQFSIFDNSNSLI
jgi:hypothetical protein